MDLNIEGTGEVSGWSPPIGEVLTPGFKATMEALIDTSLSRYQPYSDHTKLTQHFIDMLESKGYCIAKYSPN